MSQLVIFYSQASKICDSQSYHAMHLCIPFLTGETANGQFPDLVVSTMAALCQNAEEMVDSDKLYNFLRNHTPKVSEWG